MKPLASAAGATLQWHRLSLLDTRHALRGGTDTYAALQWALPIIGTTALGAWELQPTGRGGRNVELSRHGSNILDAYYQSGSPDQGIVTLPTGRRYHWAARRWTAPASWTSADGTLIARFQDGNVGLSPQLPPPADLSILILLAQYLNVRRTWVRGTRLARVVASLLSGFFGI